MNATHEFALLIAVILPVAVLLVANVALFLEGERDTLLIPGMRGFPTMDRAAMETAAAEAVARPAPAAEEVDEFRLAA
jgi:K+-transporting ATPase A subunit